MFPPPPGLEQWGHLHSGEDEPEEEAEEEDDDDAASDDDVVRRYHAAARPGPFPMGRWGCGCIVLLRCSRCGCGGRIGLPTPPHRLQLVFLLRHAAARVASASGETHTGRGSQTAEVSAATGYAPHGDGEAEPWPSELNTLDYGKFLQVSTDKRTVRYTGDGMHNNDVGAIQVRESKSQCPFAFTPSQAKRFTT